MTHRLKLPNRRRAETFGYSVDGQKYNATVGYTNGTPQGQLGAALDEIE